MSKVAKVRQFYFVSTVANGSVRNTTPNIEGLSVKSRSRLCFQPRSPEEPFYSLNGPYRVELSEQKKSTLFRDLVNTDPRVDVEDLRVFLSAKLEMHSSLWIFGVGIVLTTTLALVALPNDPLTLATKYAVLIVLLGLYIKLRRRDPEDRLKQVLAETDYLEAKKIVGDRNAGKQP
jgi:hypothetical protein